jgi:mannose-6-phosphate isomerase-like protein (cupin superfamily)
MSDETRAYLLRPGEGRSIGDGPAPAWFKAGNAETGGAFNLHYDENTRGAGRGTPLHIHHRDDECVFQIEGETAVICGGQRFILTAGCFAYLPRGVPHAVRPLTVSRSVAVIAPGTGWERMRLLMADVWTRGLSPEEVFRSLPPEAQIEVIGPADWGDAGAPSSRGATRGAE